MRLVTGSFALLRLVALPLLCCSSEPRLTLELTTGGEPDALTRAPQPTSLEVEALPTPPEMNSRMLARAPLPASAIDLGVIANGTVLTLRVRGRDISGRAVVFGQTLPVEVDAPRDVSLGVFLQRTSEFARLPGVTSIVQPGALVDRLGGRYVVLAAGLDAELFDLATFASRPFRLSRIPKTIVATKTALLTIDDGGAALVDPSGATTPVSGPTDGRGTFADVVGGTVVRGEAGEAYVIGATRAQATAVVLRVGNDGALSFLRLLEPRAGAAVAYLPKRGVMIVGGGSATGPAAELLGDGGSLAVSLSMRAPVDARAAAALDGNRVLVVGPTLSSATVIDLGCTDPCAATTWSLAAGTPADIASAKPTALARLADGSFLALTENDAGAARTFRWPESAQPIEVPTRVPHAGARLTPGVGGSVLLVGGSAEIESFVVDAP